MRESGEAQSTWREPPGLCSITALFSNHPGLKGLWATKVSPCSSRLLGSLPQMSHSQSDFLSTCFKTRRSQGQEAGKRLGVSAAAKPWGVQSPRSNVWSVSTGFQTHKVWLIMGFCTDQSFILIFLNLKDSIEIPSVRVFFFLSLFHNSAMFKSLALKTGFRIYSFFLLILNRNVLRNIGILYFYPHALVGRVFKSR